MSPCPELHIPHKESVTPRDMLENWHTLETWSRTRGCGGSSSCYVKHMEGTQTIDPPGGGIGDRCDLVEFDPANWTISECGTAPDDTIMLVCHLNWFWNQNPNDPYATGVATGSGGTVSARAVGIWGEGMTPSSDNPIAIDTRLGLGDDWTYLALEGGSLSIPLNIYPAGPELNVWVGHSSDGFLDITMRADIYTVGTCSCVL